MFARTVWAASPQIVHTLNAPISAQGMDSDSDVDLLKARRRAPLQAKQGSKGPQQQRSGSDSDSDGFDIVAAARQTRSPGKTGEPAAAKPRPPQQQVALHVRARSADAPPRAGVAAPIRSPMAADPLPTSGSSSDLDLISAARGSRSGRPSASSFAAEAPDRPSSAGRHAAKPVRLAGGAQQAVPASCPPPTADAGSDSDSGFDLVAAARQTRSQSKSDLQAAGSLSQPVRLQQPAVLASKASSASGASNTVTAQHVRSSSVPYAPATEQAPAIDLPTVSSAPSLPLPSVPGPEAQFPPAAQPPVTIMAEPELSGSVGAQQVQQFYMVPVPQVRFATAHLPKFSAALPGQGGLLTFVCRGCLIFTLLGAALVQAPAPPTAALVGPTVSHSSRSTQGSEGAALPVASVGSAGQVVRSSTGDRVPVDQPPAHSTGMQGLESLLGRNSPVVPPSGQADATHPAPATPQQQHQQAVLEDRAGLAPMSPAMADRNRAAPAALEEVAARSQGSSGQPPLSMSRRDSLAAFGDVVQQSVTGAVSDLR